MKKFKFRTILKNECDTHFLTIFLEQLLRNENKNYLSELNEIFHHNDGIKNYLCSIELFGNNTNLFNLEWIKLKKSYLVKINFNIYNLNFINYFFD